MLSLRLRSLISKKLGLTITEHNGEFMTVRGDCRVTWYEQGEKAICVSCSNVGEESDSMTDYFPGSFLHTIKEINYVLRERD
jgi:hypothetical protein